MVTSALHFVCSVIPTPETRGHVCQRFHHPTVCIADYVDYRDFADMISAIFIIVQSEIAKNFTEQK